MRSYTYNLRSLLRPLAFALSLALLTSAPTLLGMEGSGMMIASRNGMVVSKPLPYDAEVEYLESTGTQWIDTGVYFASSRGMGVHVGVYHFGTSQSKNIFGSNDASGFNAYFQRPEAIGLYLCGGYVLQYVTFPANTWHDVNWSVTSDGTNLIIIDSTNYTASPRTLNQSEVTFRLFTQEASDDRNSLIRVSTCELYENSVLVRDYIPVRFTNEQNQSEGAMYDRVSGTLFRNAGTGAFVFPTA